MDPLRLYATTPQSKDVEPADYRGKVADVARWTEAAGCHGTLIYTDNGLVDPWLVADTVLRATERLVPLVAVQPVYLHPYSAAKMVASLAFLHGRQIDVNLLAGGFRNDLLALGDPTPHDARYERTVEYGLIMRRLLEDEGPVTFAGSHYQVENLRLRPSVPPELRPNVLISGSSPAGLAAARALAAVAVRYPKPPGEEDVVDPEGLSGIGARVGIIAREDRDAAWRVALERFPPDRAGQIAHRLAMQASDSHWHRELSARLEGHDPANPYWLGPFQNYATFCPYLVGDYDRVAEELRAYIGDGYRSFILDIPRSEEDLHHATLAFDRTAIAA